MGSLNNYVMWIIYIAMYCKLCHAYPEYGSRFKREGVQFWKKNVIYPAASNVQLNNMENEKTWSTHQQNFYPCKSFSSLLLIITKNNIIFRFRSRKLKMRNKNVFVFLLQYSGLLFIYWKMIKYQSHKLRKFLFPKFPSLDPGLCLRYSKLSHNIIQMFSKSNESFWLLSFFYFSF